MDIKDKIYIIRGIQVIINQDLAKLYEVETRSLKQAVNGNMDRFPDDFMFKLDLDKYNKQYNRIKIISFDKSHDRFLILDDEICHIWHSLKDLGKKGFAFSKLEQNSLEILKKLQSK